MISLLDTMRADDTILSVIRYMSIGVMCAYNDCMFTEATIMEHIIIVKIESDRNAMELVKEIQSNLEYENISAEAFIASESLRRMIAEKGGSAQQQ